MSMNPSTRIAVERLIVRELLTHMARAGWAPYVNNDGGEHVHCYGDPAAALESVFSVDESRLHFAPAALVANYRRARKAVVKGAQDDTAARTAYRRACKAAESACDGACHAVLLIGGNAEDIISDWSFSHGDADGFDKAMRAFPDTEKLTANALGAGLQALDLLADNLNAWENEEPSVQEEHAELIDRTRALLAEVAK